VATKTEPFDVGDDVTVTLRFTDVNDAPADPSAVVVKIQSPSDHAAGAITRTLNLVDLVRASIGVYTFVQRIAQPDSYWVEATATVAGLQQVRRRLIEVRPDPTP
jgi:hypothetical protein